jgi:hypothetical protein
MIKKEAYYWIANDYLYMNDPLLTKVRIAALFEDDVPNEIMYATACAGDVPLVDWCMNPLDKPYACPGYLETQVLQLTSQKLLSTYFRIMDDKTSNNNDETMYAGGTRRAAATTSEDA